MGGEGRRVVKTAANVIEIVNYVKDMQQLHSNAFQMPKHAKILRLSHAINDSPPSPFLSSNCLLSA